MWISSRPYTISWRLCFPTAECHPSRKSVYHTQVYFWTLSRSLPPFPFENQIILLLLFSGCSVTYASSWARNGIQATPLLRQCRILNLLHWARDQSHTTSETCQICNLLYHGRNSQTVLLILASLVSSVFRKCFFPSFFKIVLPILEFFTFPYESENQLVHCYKKIRLLIFISLNL